ncbi:MAG: phage shock protein PspC (stress-responsive transcriptional regulator) [Psychrosphaera sp.]|jgi:phage shock protein PspC (stress-responsive transcriptional regulator)|uniref:PspC domain-containing protein n=1 Tax=Psychrosphaera sp. F3M07 TaxID=2841560 RepID=UPI001C09EA25|nr:PspC domain-containing protein [Psychrosphaera sp. F3M07]MBU2919058.1 PspC domain-containing protein [Psychrosphaera sp. F3M07]
MKTKYIGNPITKDLLNRKLSGVCSGIAKHYNTPVIAVRAVTIILGIMLPMPTIFAYLLATLLMPTSRY